VKAAGSGGEALGQALWGYGSRNRVALAYDDPPWDTRASLVSVTHGRA
jgi:hypothetical protein